MREREGLEVVIAELEEEKMYLEKWELIKRFENVRGLWGRCRPGERGGVARVGVTLKTTEIQWHWKEEEELALSAGGNSSGKDGKGEVLAELRPPAGRSESLPSWEIGLFKFIFSVAACCVLR